ncbi:unnamed protein product [Lampetra planeri]
MPAWLRPKPRPGTSDMRDGLRGSALGRQAGRDIAGDEGPCSEDACQVCGTFEPCSPSDPAAGTVTGQAQD